MKCEGSASGSEAELRTPGEILENTPKRVIHTLQELDIALTRIEEMKEQLYARAEEQCKAALERYKESLDAWSQDRMQKLIAQFEETSQYLQEYEALENHLVSVSSLLGK